MTDQTFFASDDFQNMDKFDLDTLIQSRLGDIADQVAHLYSEGLDDLAELLMAEGLMLAKAADNHDMFFFVQDLTFS